MRVVIDTNCSMVSIPKISVSRWLFDAVLDGTIEVGVTTDILEEYEEIIDIFYQSPELAANVVKTILNRDNVFAVSPYYFWYLISDDADDNKFVDCAVACSADYIITEDGHFRALDNVEFPKVRRLTRSQFKQILFNYQANG